MVRTLTLRVGLAVALLCVGAAAAACPLCLGAGNETRAQQLAQARAAVLAVPTAEAGRYRVVEVIKGARPASVVIEGGYPRFGPSSEPAAGYRGKALLLVRDDPFPTWVILGTIGAEHVDWLRGLAAAQAREDGWRARVALAIPYLEHREPLAAEIAYGDLAAAPYAALRAARTRLVAQSIRAWLADPDLAARQPLYLLLLGLAGNAQDAAALEQRLDVAWRAGDAAYLGAFLAADLELRGPARMAWVEAAYLTDRARSMAEINAALSALSVHGNAGGAIARERVIEAYRVFIREHPDIAGYVARDLADWKYWDAVPVYTALASSEVRQQVPSRLAILAYLRRSEERSP